MFVTTEFMITEFHSICYIVNLILTQGEDGDDVNEKDLLAYFDVKKCKNLEGKPKLFVFNTCRYDDLQQGWTTLFC
jgi:hypothetical protein